LVDADRVKRKLPITMMVCWGSGDWGNKKGVTYLGGSI